MSSIETMWERVTFMVDVSSSIPFIDRASRRNRPAGAKLEYEYGCSSAIVPVLANAQGYG